MSGHLGADLAALVDGELDDAARERALGHLARCQACRAEVDDERRFKARLLGLSASAPLPEPDLSERIRALAAEGLLTGGPTGPRRPPPAPCSPRPSRGPAGRGRRLPRTAVGGAVLLLGIGAVLALGAPRERPTRTPVDPTSDVFVVDFASVNSELPLPDPAGVTSTEPVR